ncbi:hypothetical protein PPERSA_12072 [Pseudocohnilembus persalinus]|uniref:Uncharacterized protein n=1 Tax=Pseudocohnilembus persalinus TaxID=266149 RepID=A0A0V0R8X2_PSEPJ|nr:hypothetical protein PPERSA_12072 [Pseudocohnilembus persalinus]|eukprot:KRX10948.1 hypothetical protein PPERSA_12072 [Pseudocohnilembus persalinus]
MELKNELKTLKEMENNNSKKIKEQNDLIEKIESENSKLKNQQFESLQNLGVQDLDEIQSEIASKDTRIREQQKYIDELKKQNEEQQTELKEEIHMQNQKLDEMKHLLEIEKLYEDKYEECEVLKKQIGNSSKGQSEIEKELLEKEKNIQSLHTKINNLKAKLDKEKQESVELQVTLEKKGFQIENLNKNIEKLNQENQQYKGSVQRLNEQIQLLKEEFRKQDPAVQSPDIQSKYLQYRNNLKQELQKEGSKIADFQEYLGNFVGSLESPRRNLNNQDFNVIIHSQGSQEEDLDKRNPLSLQINSNRQESSNQIQDESHNNINNNNKQNQYIDTNNNIDELNSHRTNNKQGSYGRMLTEESDDIKQNNKVLKDKIRELVIEIEALKTTLQAQDSQGIQGSSDERQGLISSNEALSDLIKKKSQLIDSLSIKVVQQEVEMNQLKKETAQVQKLKKNQKMFKNQIELVKHDYNEQIKQKEEEMKLLITVLYELRDQKAQTA